MPDGTATADMTMVEQDVFDLLARDAPLEPEKVHEVARFSTSSAKGAGVICGAGAARAHLMQRDSQARHAALSDRAAMRAIFLRFTRQDKKKLEFCFSQFFRSIRLLASTIPEG